MSDEVSRRDLIRNVALSALLGGVSADAAQHVHQMAEQDKQASGGVYKPKTFNQRDYATLQALTEAVIPGASRGGVSEYIDLLCGGNPELALIYAGGLGWLEHEMQRRYGSGFLDAKPEQRKTMLELLAYRKNSTPELAPGIEFFDWLRAMTVDGYYTSQTGIQELGYMGNTAVSEFKVPAAAIEYALKRSGLG